MIPLKLQLKNFLSYGSALQTIDFSPYHLICLSGKNGHGKSALLDAITWAIWGQARKISGVAKADQHLLRLGQQQMLVILDFEFNQQKYRIRREFALTHGKQYASLDFALVESDKVISLTNKTIRETQETIESTLGLDFESFINSAFLRQGQSNEFSKKSPKERKDILGTILGLQQYELLKKKALDKVKNGLTEVSSIKTFQEKLHQELQRLPELSQSLMALNGSLIVLDSQEKQCAFQKQHLINTKNQLLEQQNRKKVIDLQIKNKQNELQQLMLKLHEDHQTWRLYHKKHVNIVPQAHYEQQKKEFIDKIAHYQLEHQKYLELKEQELQLKKNEQELIARIQIEYAIKVQTSLKAFETLQHELAHKNSQLETLQKQKNKLITEYDTIQTSCITTAKILESLKMVKADLKTQEELFEKRKIVYRQWIAEINGFMSELKQTHQKQKLTSDENNPSCPLCEQNLSASRKKFLKNHFVQKEAFLRHRTARLEKIITSLKTILADQHAFIENFRLKAEEYTKAEVKHTELSSRLKTVESELNELNSSEYTLSQAHNLQEKQILESKKHHEALVHDEQIVINNDQNLKKLRSEIENLNKGLNSHEYNQNQLNQLRTRLSLLNELIAQSEVIHQDIDFKKSLAAKIGQYCQTIKDLKFSIKELTDQALSYVALEEQLQQLHTDEIKLNETMQHHQREKEMLLEKRGSLEKELMTLKQYQQEYDFHGKKIKELQELMQTYQVIATALGKDGIQALIIEEALPEIEQEANELLGQLTDNQAHIMIDSLRDLKKGGTKETLDIKISDSVGIRPYELFSGGEAFRIDFALRLAISKLLARRAGTSLQTLIIDEGFGSQDEDGLHHIMDALYKIQNNFCKIIIVSHLPAMKDQFPVHFFIEKGSQGSSLRVIEQG